MKSKLLKISLLLIAAVMLVSIAFAGTGSAHDGTPVDITYSNYKVLVVDNVTGAVSSKTISASWPQKIYLLEDAKDWNAVALDSKYKEYILVLGDNLNFSGMPSCNMMTYMFKGQLYGNGYLIQNFRNTSNTNNNAGLIQQPGNGIYLNYVQMTNCSLQTTGSYAGALIGGENTGTAKTISIIGCSVNNGSINGTSAGGLCGYLTGNSNHKLIMNHSHVYNSTVSTINENAGGLLGCGASGTLTVSNCSVYDSWIESSKASKSRVGGLTGSLILNSVFTNCTVSNCTIKIDGISHYIGGLIGAIHSSSPKITVSQCRVDHCNISGNYEVGGLIGYTTENSNIKISDSIVEYSHILAPQSDLGGLIGHTSNKPSVENCAVLHCNIISDSKLDKAGGLLGRGYGENFRNCYAGRTDVSGSELNVSSGQALNGTACSSPVDSSCTALSLHASPWPMSFPTKEEIAVFAASRLPYIYVTFNATDGTLGYPYSGKKKTVEIAYNRTNAVFGLPESGNALNPKFDGHTFAYWVDADNVPVENTHPVTKPFVVKPHWLVFYGITIANATGVFELTEEMTTVCGDYGDAVNGTATLTHIGTGEDNPSVLELNHFNTNILDEITGSYPYAIGTEVPLTIIVNGTSNITVEDALFGIYANTALTIKGKQPHTSQNENILNITLMTGGPTIGTNEKNLTVSDCFVKVHSGQGSALTSNYGDIILRDQSIAELSGEGGIYTLGRDIVISGGSHVIVNASIGCDAGTLICLPGCGNISITDGSVVDMNLVPTGISENNYGLKAFTDITIDASSRVNLTAEISNDRDTYGLFANEGNISLGGGSVASPQSVDIRINCSNKNAYAMWAGKDITIDSFTVTETAESAGDDKVAAGLYADTGDITIKNKAQVTAKANATGAAFSSSSTGARAVWAKTGNITITGKNTQIDAQTNCSYGNSIAIQAGSLDEATGEPVEKGGYLRIRDGSTVTAESSSNEEGCGNPIYTTHDIEIKASNVIANVPVNMGEGCNLISACAGNITVSDSSDVRINGNSKYAGIQGMHAKRTGEGKGGNIEIDSSHVIVSVKSDESTVYGLNAEGIGAEGGNLTIKGANTIIDVDVTGGAGALAFNANNMDIQSGDITAKANYTEFSLGMKGVGFYGVTSITISGCDQIKATGTNTSFATYAELSHLNFDGLKTGYVFSNATNPGSEPTSYESFTKNWQIDDMNNFVSNYTSVLIEKKSTPTPTPSPYTPSHRESGQTVIQQQAPVQDVSADPTPANQATADITVKYVGQSVLGTSTSDSAALKEQYPEAAAQVELSFALAMEAGIPLTNSKGAKAVVVTDQNIPDIEKVTFSRVYEISPANEGEKLTKVTVKVPKSDITFKGLTSEDVNIYHYLDTYNIWVPLETLSVSQDENNYYYTAATDGTSPFGVLVKKIGGDDTTVPTTQPTQKSPAPFVGIIAGLGAALVIARLRR